MWAAIIEKDGLRLGMVHEFQPVMEMTCEGVGSGL